MGAIRMYFGIDVNSATLYESALSAIEANLLEYPGALIHALVDGCFDETLDRRFRSTVVLYEGSRLEALRDVSPRLVTLPASLEARARILGQLLDTCDGKPMLSFVASRLDAAALRTHLSPLLLATTPDGMEWPLRFADTRVIPALFRTLSAQRLGHLVAPLHAWWIIDRQGTLQAMPCDPLKDIPSLSPFSRLPISDEEFAALMDLAEADAVLAEIADHHPQLLTKRAPAECHGVVAASLRQADEYGIDGAGNRRAYCLLALSLRPGFDTLPAMASVLERVRGGADFYAETARLPDEFWCKASP